MLSIFTQEPVLIAAPKRWGLERLLARLISTLRARFSTGGVGGGGGGDGVGGWGTGVGTGVVEAAALTSASHLSGVAVVVETVSLLGRGTVVIAVVRFGTLRKVTLPRSPPPPARARDSRYPPALLDPC